MRFSELIRHAFPEEYEKREKTVQEIQNNKLLKDLRFIFCRSAHNAAMVSKLGSDEHGYVRCPRTALCRRGALRGRNVRCPGRRPCVVCLRDGYDSDRFILVGVLGEGAL